MKSFLGGGFINVILGLPVSSLIGALFQSLIASDHLALYAAAGLMIVPYFFLLGGLLACVTDRVGRGVHAIPPRMVLGGGIGILAAGVHLALLRLATPRISLYSMFDWDLKRPDSDVSVKTVWLFLAAALGWMFCGVLISAWTCREDRPGVPVRSRGWVGLFLGCIAISAGICVLFWEAFPPRVSALP